MQSTNYIHRLIRERDAAEADNAALRDALVELKAYLSSDKFTEDENGRRVLIQTVATQDVRNRIDAALSAGTDARFASEAGAA